VGFDLTPPRRRLFHTEFRRVHPTDRDGITALVRSVDPHVIVHVAVYEPHARVATHDAVRFTEAATAALVDAASATRSLEAFVARSGLEVYGRRRGSPELPTEGSPLHPTSAFGRALRNVEYAVGLLGAGRGVATAAVRLAPVIGRHVPSPLGRLLRLPVVPFQPLANPSFSIVEDGDAAAALVAAAARRLDGPVNVVAPGSISVVQAARHGRRIAIPVLGPSWRLVRALSHVLGAPVPDHVAELLTRGRLGDGERISELLGFHPQRSAEQIVERLYHWPSVTRIVPHPASDDTVHHEHHLEDLDTDLDLEDEPWFDGAGGAGAGDGAPGRTPTDPTRVEA
jgi:UDP-glucose 4-epimerase